MNRKLMLLLLLAITIILTALIGLFGVNPFNANPIQAKYINFVSEDLSIDEKDNVYYYLPYLEANETKRVNLGDYVSLDPNATYQKESLRYYIVYDNDEEANRLELIEEGALTGWLTISGQTSATVTVSTTDGSGLSAVLLIRPTKNAPQEHYSGDIFK